jgi:hypothetical protein
MPESINPSTPRFKPTAAPSCASSLTCKCAAAAAEGARARARSVARAVACARMLAQDAAACSMDEAGRVRRAVHGRGTIGRKAQARRAESRAGKSCGARCRLHAGEAQCAYQGQRPPMRTWPCAARASRSRPPERACVRVVCMPVRACVRARPPRSRPSLRVSLHECTPVRARV